MSTTDNRPTHHARWLALVIADQARIGRISYSEALTAFRLDLGQLLAAAIDTADLFKAKGHGDWAQAEMDAARGYAVDLLAIADFTHLDIQAIYVLSQAPAARS